MLAGVAMPAASVNAQIGTRFPSEEKLVKRLR